MRANTGRGPGFQVTDPKGSSFRAWRPEEVAVPTLTVRTLTALMTQLSAADIPVALEVRREMAPTE